MLLRVLLRNGSECEVSAVQLIHNMACTPTGHTSPARVPAHAPCAVCVDPLPAPVIPGALLLQSRPGPSGDSLSIVALTGTRARAWYNTTFVNMPVIAPPLPLPATAAGTLLPNKPSPVVHSVRSPSEIRVSSSPGSSRVMHKHLVMVL